ncbi:hypothetical protein FZEAL_9031 [Fusarium zealandicum]|uniref:Uncharacterized protein n=1 Tax=Fusarium zealandicum TaxID=1053134 RepID=A0A8H4UD01_9HYPO|nr:hypothetical protein FZEAL_9031 [Fusarium zealandicum]
MPRPMDNRPDWYYRVLSIARARQPRTWDDLDTRPEDYDEDISETDSVGSCSSQTGCEYDSNDECTKHVLSDEDSDSSSASGGSDIDSYYHMKQERKQRKRELRDQRKHANETLNKDLEYERGYENEVKEVLAKVQASTKKKPAPLSRIGGRVFKIWSTDHVKYCPRDDAPTMYVEFYAKGEHDPDKQDAPERKPKQIRGHMYMHSEVICYLDRFIPPKLPSAKVYQLAAEGGKWKLDVQFIDDNYMTFKVSRELIATEVPVLPEAPPFLTYYGICEDHMAREEKRTRQEQEEQRRSASPRR